MTFWDRFEKTSQLGAAYPWSALALLVALLAIIRFDPAALTRMRTAAVLFAISALGCLIGAFMLHWRYPEEGHLYLGVRFVSVLIQSIAMINIASVVVFDGGLKTLRLRPPQITQDLILAIAYIGVAIALLAKSGVDLRGIVATSAILTAVIGFSLQDALGNIVGGMAIQMEQTIRPGDWIRIDELEGKVKEIRWRQTSLETRNWDTVVVPNSALVKGKVTLLGRRTGKPRQRRQWIYFHVDLTHSPTKVIQAVETALRAEPISCVADEPEMHCIVTEVKNGDATYAVRYWLNDLSQPDPTDSLIRTRIYAALRRAAIPLSIPAQAVILTEEQSQREQLQIKEAAQRAAALEGLEFFQPLTEEERGELKSALIDAPFVRGEAMTRQGAQANWLYIIIEGEAEVRVAVDGLTKKVAVLHPGDYFGEMGMMTGEPRTATVIALTDVRCYRLGKEPFERILRRRPELATHISETLAQRRVELEAAKEEISKEAYRDRVLDTQSALLRRIRGFFGLASEKAA